MKKLIIVSIIGLLSFTGYSQNFEKYDSMKDVDAVVMTSKMFKLLSKVDLSSTDPEAQQYLNLIENLKEIRIYTSGALGSEVLRQVAEEVLGLDIEVFDLEPSVGGGHRARGRLRGHELGGREQCPALRP